jgi:serpin B
MEDYIMKTTKIFISLLLLAAITLNIMGCGRTAASVKADDLMADVPPNRINAKTDNDAFTANMADFSINLFKKAIVDKENSLVSPLSVMLALAMTANGADSETLSQMQKLLGGEIPLPDLNEYLYSYVKGLPNGDKSKLGIANSIWFRNGDSLNVKPDFLQKNADYYNASVYEAAFDSQTVKNINDWVKSHTDGMIEKIVEQINDDVMLYLINAVVFDAEWRTVYSKEDIRENDFTDINGEKHSIDFMHSKEYKYLDDGRATGFIKPYVNDSYSFAALLPNEDIAIEEYINMLTGAEFADTIKKAEETEVNASMPKFDYEYEIKMNDALTALGMPDAFDSDKADFKKMARSEKGNIYIGEVLHKTYISVDELGTKAGAVTSVMMRATGMPLTDPDPKEVNLNRPFVYAIIDNATDLPVFIGAVMVFD